MLLKKCILISIITLGNIHNLERHYFQNDNKGKTWQKTIQGLHEWSIFNNTMKSLCQCYTVLFYQLNKALIPS